MTKLDALNQIIKIILEGEKEGKTILSAINEAVKRFGGKGDAITNGQAINQLYEVFTGEKENLIPENIRKGVNILGVEGEDYIVTFVENPSLQDGKLSMRSVASNIASINTKLLSSFKHTSMYYMFHNCSSLTSLDLSSFDTSQVTDMGYMFHNCPSHTSLTLGANWASNNSITRFDLSSCPLTKESALDVLNKLADRTATTNKPTLRLKSTVKALLSDDEIKIATDKGWTVA